MKELKDYLPLYLGCRLKIGDGAWVDNSSITLHNHLMNLETGKGLPIKLCLRPLSDMTEEEAKELLKIRYGKNGWSQPIYERHSSLCIDFKFASSDGKFNETQLDWDGLDAESVRYLLSKHFDLFNLIPENLAIDKSTLTDQK